MIDQNQQSSLQNQTPFHSCFIKRNWLTIITSLLGIGFSLYFYLHSKSEREPVFLVDPVKTIVIDSKVLPKTTLQVIKGNNIPIEGDITSIRFYFWNNGKEPIRREHILLPIVISLGDKQGEILDYKLLSSSRPDVINAIIERNERDPKTSININFRILEKDDGFTGQILYSGDPNKELLIKGVIEGVREIETNASLLKMPFYKSMFLNFGLPILLVFFICVFVWVLVFSRKARQRISHLLDQSTDAVDIFLSKTLGIIFPRFGKLLAIVIPTIALILIIFLVWKFQYEASKKEATKNLITIIPSQIRP
jgi:hypothetical protein